MKKKRKAMMRKKINKMTRRRNRKAKITILSTSNSRKRQRNHCENDFNNIFTI